MEPIVEIEEEKGEIVEMEFDEEDCVLLVFKDVT